MRILVCGDREWKDRRRMESVLFDIFCEHDTLIFGCCRGADNMAYDILHAEYGNEINYAPYPAEWNKYGKAAGHIRNKQMIDEGRPELVLAFHNNIDKSKGTLNMIKQANKAGIEVRIYSSLKR